MWWFSLAVVAGCFAGLSLPIPYWLPLTLLPLAWYWRATRWSSWVLVIAGIGWGAGGLYQAQNQWLPVELDGEVLELTGRVTGLPRSSPLGDSWRWQLELDQVVLPAESQLLWPGKHRLRLSIWAWDGTVKAGDVLRVRARLSRPRGWVNQGSTDRARFALARGIAGRGSVREILEHKPGGPSLDRQRAAFSASVAQRLGDTPVARALLPALVAGDRRGMEGYHWERLQRTGTAHLMAISGLHITLVAGLVWWAARWLLVPVLVPAGRISAQQWAVLPALSAAIGYAALAGFALPTIRALLMTSVALLALCWRLRPALPSALGCALLVVLLFDPMAVFDNSFWLSFTAVAMLLLLAGGGGVGLLRMQLTLSLGLGALAGWMFLHWGLASPLANLILVPLFSLLIVPLALAGSLLPGADWLLWLAARLIEWSWLGLGWLEQVNLQLPPPASPASGLLVLAAVLLLMLPALPLPRWLPLFLLLPWFWPRADWPAPGEFDVIFFDVGQGQAIAVRTHEHLILYDLGPGWSGGDAGRLVVEPWLRRHRLRPDLVFVSHGDLDHAGGLASLEPYIRPGTLYTGEIDRLPGSQPCQRGQQWSMDEVRIEVLWPEAGLVMQDANNRSCVVKITSATGSVLLTGDITHSVEYWLSARHAGSLDLLQVPHHGGNGSSSYTFLRAMQPAYAVASAGYLNPFGHPADAIRRRYAELDIPLLVTAETGMIVFPIRDQDNAGPVLWRDRYRRPWRPASDN